MSDPAKLPSPRQMLHLKYCKAVGACQFVFVGGRADDEAFRKCRKLDELLDFNDEQLLHARARELRDEVSSRREKRAGVGAGLLRAADMTDPYEKITAFDSDFDDFNEAAEKHPDCPVCAEGTEHYHRKADGSPVRAPF